MTFIYLCSKVNCCKLWRLSKLLEPAGYSKTVSNIKHFYILNYYNIQLFPGMFCTTFCLLKMYMRSKTIDFSRSNCETLMYDYNSKMLIMPKHVITQTKVKLLGGLIVVFSQSWRCRVKVVVLSPLSPPAVSVAKGDRRKERAKLVKRVKHIYMGMTLNTCSKLSKTVSVCAFSIALMQKLPEPRREPWEVDAFFIYQSQKNRLLCDLPFNNLLKDLAVHRRWTLSQSFSCWRKILLSGLKYTTAQISLVLHSCGRRFDNRAMCICFITLGLCRWDYV